MTALARMRLASFARSGRALAPLIAALIALAVLYGGGEAQAAEAYGVSAVVMFPVLAWQTKLLLDAEPDVQRRLALVAGGSPVGEVSAGLLAGAAAALVSVVVALVAPWLVGGITGPAKPTDLSLGAQLAIGAWAHLVTVPAAVMLGALASRAVTRGVAYGLTTLAVGVVATLALGLKGSAVPWLVPPVMATARAAGGATVTGGATAGPGLTALLAVSGHALAWTAVAVAGYVWLRRTRT